ncbi:exonuclease [Pyrenochaeta sp. MPI-SDFR-AT-0127]|nr:exonuclease [Pyrenochaeta sp. MPI-SDFR-AT-0127]
MATNNIITHVLVDTESSVIALIDILQTLPKHSPCLYVDLEGVRLSRLGRISIITVFAQPQNCVYLVDVHKLQAAAFNTATANGTTLKSVFESPDISKVFFGLHIQLMENAARPTYQRRNVNGLDRCIAYDAPITPIQRRDWKLAKDKGRQLFLPTNNGSYEVFNQRPLSPDIVQYCIIDVQFLPSLRNLYWERLNSIWKAKVAEETIKRVQESQSPHYQPNAENKKFGPWGY